MDKQERDEIRARCEAATGLWRAFDEYRPRILIDSLNRIAIECTHLCDAEFVSHARENIPALLDAIDALEAERDKYKARCEAMERALLKEIDDPCDVCVNQKDRGEHNLCPYCDNYGENWQFDEARFSGGDK